MRPKNHIRMLRPGEAQPAGEPRRYRSGHGYIRLRWKVGLRSYVETYEHRLVAGLPSATVHHRNEQKDDNARGNLEALSRPEHVRRHNPFTWDVDCAANLYRSGWTLPQLEAKFGKNTGQIYRGLRSRGVQMREPGAARRLPIDVSSVSDLHALGFTARAIAESLSVTVNQVRRVIKSSGAAPRPCGRPRKQAAA